RGAHDITDKFSRAKSALKSGAEIVLELPYAYSVQSSKLFAQGAITILNELKINSLCFGSESGFINDFINSFETLKNKQNEYDTSLQLALEKGLAYPAATNLAYQAIGFDLDILEPNNTLGFSYVKIGRAHV